jgi:hydrogenase expression/formation protein HypC
MARIDEEEAAITLAQLQKMGSEYDNELEQFSSTSL